MPISAFPAPTKVVKWRKRSALRGGGSGRTRRSLLWAKLKRIAPEKAAKFSYTQVSTEQLEPMVDEARKAKWTPQRMSRGWATDFRSRPYPV